MHFLFTLHVHCTSAKTGGVGGGFSHWNHSGTWAGGATEIQTFPVNTPSRMRELEALTLVTECLVLITSVHNPLARHIQIAPFYFKSLGSSVLPCVQKEWTQKHPENKMRNYHNFCPLIL